MPDDILKTMFLPVALILLMVGMGMGLTLTDFRRVLLSPKATLVGLALQLLALPVLAFGLVYVFRLPGELAAGLMLVAACPGGPTSNIISHLSRGDTALSVTLTAFSSVITVFTIPLVVGLAMERFLEGGVAIQLPFLKTFIQLMVVTVIPIAIGMWLHSAKPEFCQKMAKPVNIMSLVFLGLIIVAAVVKEKDLGAQIVAAGPAVVALNLGGMALGALVAGSLGLGKRQRISISVEAGIQNGTLALAIALGLLDSSRMAVPAVVYSLFMFVSGAAMIFWFGRGLRQKE
ncbi:bile acid:sodium symporter family protein [Luteolibacter sp. AS25]|uniref:bile acid:sodium symporter family protein n=1 Tax=Luteolibacter sp. AS25 TaxID=3135776 RepID=UPI00398AD233